MQSLQTRYKEKLKSEGWHSDAVQTLAIAELSRLAKELNFKKSLWPFGKKEEVRGVYMYGGVGRGKSMLMDLFFDFVPQTTEKRRVHFHEFMIETHDWLHANRGSDMADLLPAYARHVSEDLRLLCFDEFHVTDVADAMILGRLFTALMEQGVIVVSTSNWAPDHLYEGGLQRELFLPFIELLKRRLVIVHLNSDTDYRQISDPDQDIYYFHPLNPHTRQKIDFLFQELRGKALVEIKTITVKGRKLNVTTANNMARFTFADLCEKALGAEDYIKIAQTFGTVFVENIPPLNAEKRNEAKRFILLIDCLYEAHCRVILSAEHDIHHLYDGSDHAFEFDRTVSRMMEMQSGAYHEERRKS